jgi:hypothetical protein
MMQEGHRCISVNDNLPQETPDNGELYGPELLPTEISDRPSKQARITGNGVPFQVLPASNRPSILRSVVKGASFVPLLNSHARRLLAFQCVLEGD